MSVSIPDVPSGMLVEDLDLDGRPDVALPHSGLGKVSVLLGRGGGRFAEPTLYDAGLAPLFVAAGRLDGDPLPDLLVVNNGSSSVSVLLSNGDGGFRAGPEVEVGLGPRVAVLADLDLDGNTDAVVSNLASRDIRILLGDGEGSFREGERLDVGDNPHSLVAGQFAGNGAPDLAVARRDDSFRTGAVKLFVGRGDGTFEPARETDLREVEAVPRILNAGDYDEDGSLDLTVLSNEGVLLLLRNDGSGYFEVLEVARAEGLGASFFTGFLVTADFDRDDRLDLVTPLARRGDSGMRVFSGHGDGSFEPLRDFFLGPDIAAIELVDLDGDDDLEAIVGWTDREELAVYEGLGPGALATRSTIPLTSGPRKVLTLDVDRDGAQDMVAVMTDAIHVLHRQKEGSFAEPQVHKFPGSSFQDMAVADFDGEEGLELALTDLTSSELWILPLAADGSIGEGRRVRVEDLPSLVVAADFGGDDELGDVVVSSLGSESLTLVLDPGGEEPPRIVSVPSGPNVTAFDARDMDGDGDADLAVATPDGIRVFLGNGAGEFSPHIELEGWRSVPALRIADLESDGAVDLVAVFRRSLVIFDGVMLGEPVVTELDLGAELRPLEVADANGDGVLDLVTASTDPDELVVVVGLAAGKFASPERHPAGVRPQALALADLDGDPWLDCALASREGWSISIFHGVPPAAPVEFRRGDADLDGTASLTDALMVLKYLYQGGEMPECPDAGDADDDGQLLLTDAVYLLLHLFAGGDAPPDPGPESCGTDPTGDALERCSAGC